jgi:Ala-tRNA(Pro) deacylase
MVAPTWARDWLKARGVPYQELHHRGAYTAQEMAQQEHISGHQVAKVVLMMVDDQPVELILPATRRVVPERVREALGARTVRFATEEEMARELGDCEVGAVPPLRHWLGVGMVMDKTMRVPGDIVFQAGTHTDALRVPFNDWFKVVWPRVESFSEPALSVGA